ncbi:MAG: alanine--tRNA ligase [Fidelibacterota bacterium]
MNSNEIRQQFIKFFQGKDHTFVPSASLIPQDDPSLIFTNAGMNQFKSIFLGMQSPKNRRVVNSQKCIRVSGKHNDLEDVGLDTYHHTFFEMLGNWSFGDYQKKEAIQWAWELLTQVWGLDKERLWATVYEEDDEAEELWKSMTDIDPSRVLRFGKKYNFWEMGETGPCGPCSEIHYYIGKDSTKQSPQKVNVSPNYWELWNLVFIQYDCQTDGSLQDLAETHVDTGAGLERLTAVLQNKISNYDTDLFQPIIATTETLLNRSYSSNPIALRVIADHIRMLTFAIADGVMPSNEGRGYVVRRVLRRAARFGHRLDQQEPFLHKLVKTVVNIMAEAYPEVQERQKHIEKVIHAEEMKFNETLDRGLDHFDKITQSIEGKEIPGEAAFKLYDTYGFPIDLTEQMAREKGLNVDKKGFEAAMANQKEAARSSKKFRMDLKSSSWQEMTKGDDSEFVGYDQISSAVKIRRYQKENDTYFIVLDKTPFYAKQGGQVGDTGVITGKDFRLRVIDTVKAEDSYVHLAEMIEGGNITASEVTVEVDNERRDSIRKNHTATHLLHKALKIVLGDHVHQAGSLVGPDYLRFDLTHYEKVLPDQLTEIEEIVNNQILLNIPLNVTLKGFEEARSEGAEAIFEEKYGDTVRMITIGDFSKELCGGTHVTRTGDIGFFKITDESSLSSGVRRLFAVTGHGAFRHVGNGFQLLATLQGILNTPWEELDIRVRQLLDKNRELEKKLRDRSGNESAKEINLLLNNSLEVNGRKLVIGEIEADDVDHLKRFGDLLISGLGSGIGALAASIESKLTLLFVVTQDLIEAGVSASDIAREQGKKLGGGGGGRPHLATAGVKYSDSISEILANIEKDLTELMAGFDG